MSLDVGKVSRETKFVVACGTAGIAPYPTFDNEADARARYEEEKAIPSYLGQGRTRPASLYKITTRTERLA